MGESGDFPKESGDPSVPSPDRRSQRVVGDHENVPESREKFVEQALAEFESALIGYAMGFVHDLDRARDVVQDTFIRLCRQDIDKVRSGLKGWLFTVCRNRALDVLRKESRMIAIEEDEHEIRESIKVTPHDAVDLDERIGQLLAYMDRLPENQKTVILMKFRDGMSYKEISEATGLAGGNVGFLIHTGLKRLRKILPNDLLEGHSK